jgi:hypothetical protein
VNSFFRENDNINFNNGGDVPSSLTTPDYRDCKVIAVLGIIAFSRRHISGCETPVERSCVFKHFFRGIYFLLNHTHGTDDTLIFSPHLRIKHARGTMQDCPVD